jgi:Domain of unknown function (DUF4136)
MLKRTYLFLLLVVAVGCSPEIQTYTDYDPDYDQWTFKTFDWSQKVNTEQNQNPLYYNELNDKRIKKAVLRQLQKHHYELTSNSPHLILHYHIVVEDKSVIMTEPFGYGYGPYWKRRPQQVYTYTQGTLILDLMDTRINQLVWRGWAVSAVDGLDSPEKIDKLIELAVRKMFVKFPTAKP